ncbi:MAG: hypothetical protein DRG83_20390, partial [Deltaproteobacteria bacterium]
GISLTTWVIGIITALLLVLFNVCQDVHEGMSYIIGVRPNDQSLLSIFFLMIIVSSVFGIISEKMRPTPKEFAFMSSIFFVVFGVTSWDLIPYMMSLPLWAKYSKPFSEELAPFQPSDWAPSWDVLDKWFNVGGVVDWGAWMPHIMSWMPMVLLWCLFNTFLGLIVRQLWIDIEGLEFPLTRLITTSVKMGTTYQSQSKPTILSRRAKTFWIGFLIGILFYQAIFFEKFIPGWPNILRLPIFAGWDCRSMPWVIENLPGAQIQGAIIPGLIAVYFLLPTEILFSAVVFWVIFEVIIATLQVQMGVVPYDPKWSSRALWGTYALDKGFIRYGLWAYGAIIAAGVIPLIIHRTSLIDTVRLALGKKAKQLTEENAPISYRWTYTALIILFVALLSWLIAYGVPVHVGILLIIITSLFALGNARLIGEGVPDVVRVKEVIYPMFNDLLPGVMGQPAYVTQTIATLWVSANWGPERANPLTDSLSTYRIGSDLGCRTRDIFLGNLLGIITGVIIAYPLYIYLFGSLGALTKAKSGWAISLHGRIWNNEILPTVTQGYFPFYRPYLPHLVIGAIFATALYIIRLRFLWFPLHPAGFIAICGNFFGYINVANMFIAWIIKYITLKFGGAEIYEKHGVPMVVGIVTAWALLAFAGDIYSLATLYAGK